MICEICGKSTRTPHTVNVDGTLLKVCDVCAKFGKEVTHTEMQMKRIVLRRRSKAERDVFDEMSEDLIENYPEIIRNARMKHGLTQDDLGKKMGEKRSVIQKLEAGEMVPDNTIIKKLERCLGIRITAPKRDVKVQRRNEARPLTIGDLIRLAKEK